MTQKTTILLCEDEENLGMLLREYLQAKGYETQLCEDGEAGWSAFQTSRPDICILDVMMPKKDGFSLAQDIKAVDEGMPIIFLTAKTMREDILQGFKLGADDYITKPFSMQELTMRIEAVMRRVQGRRITATQMIQIGHYQFDYQKQILSYGDEKIKLTTKESELLKLLCNHPSDMLERDYALKTIWNGGDSYFSARSMDVYIAKLRKLLSRDPEVQIINVHGRGYKIVIPEE